MKRTTRTSKAVPKRSALHNKPIDYSPDSKRLATELESFFTISTGGKIPTSVATASDVSKVFKSFSTPKIK